jgi:hypothetical protein
MDIPGKIAGLQGLLDTISESGLVNVNEIFKGEGYEESEIDDLLHKGTPSIMDCCPLCKEDDIDYGDIDIFGDECSQNCRCKNDDCEYVWSEVYIYSKAEG